ncbi:MAG: DUF4399 domain-containing protein [Pseudomonadota bacterium]
MRMFAFAVAAALLFAPLTVSAQETPSAPNASVYFINLKDGDTVSSPVTVQFGLKNMGVAPAGTEKANTGHHHLLVDRPPLGKGPDGADELTNALPSDDNHLHFGKGQTETTLTLKPGKHTMQLVMGDWTHVPHKRPVVSEVITITVK